jgi:hypothetical protein
MDTSDEKIDLTHEHPGEHATVGMWEPIQYRCHSLPVHAALLHTGKVLLFGGSGNNRKFAEQPRMAELWDPESGAITIIEQNLGGDIFCAGHAFLPDGRLLVSGGTHKYDIKRHLFGRDIPIPPFTGINHTYLFDPVQERWTRGDNMAAARWYPTLVMLGDGRVMAMAGLTEGFPWVMLRKIEIYAPGEGWQHLKGADRWLPLYPRLHLLPDGRVFYSGSYNTHYTFPFSLQQFPTSILDPKTGQWDWLGLPNQSEREEGATVLLPLDPPDYCPRVLLIGGGTTQGAEASPDCEMIDLSVDQPRWQVIEPMHHARYYVYAVLLPDGKILALGGRSGTKGHDHVPDDPDPHHPGIERGPVVGREMGDPSDGTVPHDPRSVLEPELFDPGTGHWTRLAPMTVDRLYHSCALLLPDGRVAVFGNNPQQGLEEMRVEIYHPSYLFRDFRPELRDAPSSAGLGQTIEIRSPEAMDVDAVVLIHPTATTHCLNPDQRLVRLEFLHTGGDMILANLPKNPNVLPPGYYMLFILVDGVPSVSRMIQVRSTDIG